MTDPYIGINATKIDFFDNELGAIRTLKQLSNGTYATPSSGWIATGTFTYASASTITVASGAASIYQKGDKLAFTQHGTDKQMYVIAVADTLLTVIYNGAQVVENTATYPITLPYYSRIENPFGFLHWFNWTPTITWTAGTAPSGSPTKKQIFMIKGSSCIVSLMNYTYTGGLTVTGASIPLPVLAVDYQPAYAFVGLSTNAPNQTLAYVTGAAAVISTTSVSADRIDFFATYQF